MQVDSELENMFEVSNTAIIKIKVIWIASHSNRKSSQICKFRNECHIQIIASSEQRYLGPGNVFSTHPFPKPTTLA